MLPQVAAVPINDALGYRNVSADWSEPTGVTRPSGYAYLHLGDGDPGKVERVLAHEFVHMTHFETDAFPWMDDLRATGASTDQLKAWNGVQEGTAVYVADVYADRYLEVRNNSAFLGEYRNRSQSHWSALAPYHFGHRYVRANADSPADLDRLFADPPETTEQLIHDERPATEPKAELSVRTEAAASDWQFVANDTLGEMTTRGALGNELDRSTAARAAAGWGTDELVAFQHSVDADRPGWVWVHRWDDGAEADEAADPLGTYAQRRDGDSAYGFRVVSISEATTALVFGSPSFVSTTNVTGSASDVTVTVDG
jgi:hypothetical protein